MEQVDQRAALAALIAERGEDFASLSRLLGRNAAYVQQFIRRGVPRKLDEADRATLARYFGVAEAVLGGPPSATGAAGPPAVRGRDPDALVAVPKLDVGASAGPGAIAGGERPVAAIAFREGWLREIGSGRPDALSIIRVDGDSMTPTLAPGDEIMVDRADAADRLRDGIYVLRIDDALLVKRLALDPATRRFAIRSDNTACPDWGDCDPGEVEVIGRVVWAGRRL